MLAIIRLTTKTDKVSNPEECLFDSLLVQFITSNSLVGVIKKLILILFLRKFLYEILLFKFFTVLGSN